MSPPIAAVVLVLAVGGLAAVLLRSPGDRMLADRLPRPPPPPPSPRPGGRQLAVPVLGAAVVTACVMSLLTGLGLQAAGGRALGLMVDSGLPGAVPFLAVIAAVAVRARRRTRRRRRAATARRSLIRAVEVLVAELQAGAPGLDALSAASADLPELESVASGARLGGSVPAGLVALSDRVGLSGLRQLAAAWAVSSDTGSGLALTLHQLVDALREDEATQDETEVALATPRATARLLSVLPVGGIGLGTLIGADPWAFLTGSPAGIALAVVGTLLAGIGLEWVERLADRAGGTGSGRQSVTRRSRGRRAEAHHGGGRR